MVNNKKVAGILLATLNKFRKPWVLIGIGINVNNEIPAEIAKVVKIPEVRDRMLALGAEIVASSPADLGAWVREQTASWAKVVRAANIKPE